MNCNQELDSPVVQWLGLRALTAEVPGSIPGQGTKIPQVSWCEKEKKWSRYFFTWDVPEDKINCDCVFVSFLSLRSLLYTPYLHLSSQDAVSQNHTPGSSFPPWKSCLLEAAPGPSSSCPGDSSPGGDQVTPEGPSVGKILNPKTSLQSFQASISSAVICNYYIYNLGMIIVPFL